ncbi:type III-B CRISPR-associated protein Cas10/Cmr2 [Heliophilum fasciatum]|uniref:CRISPR-associated protein Cas10/Cmr2 subtype III-B n=1 Tax=Heliophilum fasciatum TaxID=35700 RepID=A0A4V2SW29_9FIRM|nr:type III-B CRISPR-associated protein Cas10/Cmr2 [Heliophilum fasciatum]MCW2279325.1 CRISPR-associated protein Cmr2 [Heliophilum fasciatum]TCP60306.1 CRISPR-associated protein Cas10/Cmr2 subtype III-B [Heliophilum fasciatum]
MPTNWGLKTDVFLAALPWDAFGWHDQPMFIRERISRHADRARNVDAACRMAKGWDSLFDNQVTWDDFWRQPEITHPLTGNRFAFSQDEQVRVAHDDRLAPVDCLAPVARALGEALQDAAIAILDEYGAEEKTCFLVLWRTWPERAQALLTERGYGEWAWSVARFPANPAVPDHSMWERAAHASALAGCIDGERVAPSLLLFNLTSAQDFIASARRTQDFWMGSYLLSYLAWIAIKTVAEEYGPDCLVFPSLREQALVDHWLSEQGNESKQGAIVPPPSEDQLFIASLPNVFTAIVPVQEHGISIGERLTAAVQTCRDEIFAAARRHVEGAVQRALQHRDVLSERVRRLVERRIRNREWRQPMTDHLLAFLESMASEQGTWYQTWQRQSEHFLSADLYWTLYPWPSVDVEQTHVTDHLQAMLQEYERFFGDGTDPETSLAQRMADCLERLAQDPCNAHGEERANGGMLYPMVAALAARWHATRKNLRHFTQPSGDEAGERCSLCGRREALCPDGAPAVDDPFVQVRLFWDLLAELGDGTENGDGSDRLAARDASAAGADKDSRIAAKEDRNSGADTGREPYRSRGKLAGRIRRGEHLCALCLTKRLSMEAFFVPKLKMDYHLFPSTASIATAGYKEALLHRLAQAGFTGELAVAARKYGQVTHRWLKKHGILHGTRPLRRLDALVATITEAAPEQRTWLEQLVRIDGSWLYEESFEPEQLRLTYGDERVNDGASEALRALRRLLAVMSAIDEQPQQQPVGPPSRYLATVVFDGDHLGYWVSGKRAIPVDHVVHSAWQQGMPALGLWDDWRRPGSVTAQMVVSDILRDFSLKVVPYVTEERHLGRVIYAGGDDVALLATAADGLAIARELRLHYGGQPMPGGSDDAGETGAMACREGFIVLHPRQEATQEAWIPWPNGANQQVLVAMGVPSSDAGERYPSASAAVIVFHHSQNLAGVIAEAGTLLKQKAKEGMGRDAFVLCLNKRSGGGLEVAAKWQYGSPDHPVDTVRMIQHAQALWQGGVSPSFANSLRQEEKAIRFGVAERAGQLPGAAESEVARALIARLTVLLKKHTAIARADWPAMERLLDEIKQLVEHPAFQQQGIWLTDLLLASRSLNARRD